MQLNISQWIAFAVVSTNASGSTRFLPLSLPDTFPCRRSNLAWRCRVGALWVHTLHCSWH